MHGEISPGTLTPPPPPPRKPPLALGAGTAPASLFVMSMWREAALIEWSTAFICK